ncbi:MAG: hypothetical protein PHI38_07825 [Sulfurimonas sp.]|jgi:hypothetical protein|uniref:hypothetical protein n=1 Tax=Sulfurimonas sp. TaxID=2022749 RepID=UPI0026361219|nr:hypothetical protein [Sulfurimonas sp.]MDD3476762.1 hypothetical protein [Sulfurimonas sp.]
MKKTLYIHIGIGKTGTSAIQKTLFDSRQKLLDAGYYYPLTGLAVNNIGHHLLAAYQEKQPSEKTKVYYDQLAYELSNVEQFRIILSSEQFCYCKSDYLDFVKDFFSQFEIKIIFFVREQVKLVESTYMWWLSQGYNYKYNIRDFFQMAQGGFNYNWMINPWVQHFGEDAINVKVYDKNILSRSNGIIKYFMNSIDEDVTLPEQTQDINKSLNNYYSYFISFLDQTFPELLNVNSVFFKTRVQIVNKLIFISDTNLETALIKKEFDEIIELLKTRFSFDNKKENYIKIFLTNFMKNLDLNHSLIDEEFRKEILEYYKNSNNIFSNRFLNGMEKEYFMKNYTIKN